jgi:hypothetical protein
MRLLFRPIDEWPAPFTTSGKAPQFSAKWSDTLGLFDRELTHLGAREAVIQVAADERGMRLDGGLRADAKVSHPGVIVSFETKKYGPMRYFTDVFDKGSRWVKGTKNEYGWYSGGRSEAIPGWQMNARAIALGLEALRKVDRYGITKRGEQYTGWSALPPATPMGAGAMTVEQAADFIAEHSTRAGLPLDRDDILDMGAWLNDGYRMAAKVLHPDAGGSTQDFQKLQVAKRILDEAVA